MKFNRYTSLLLVAGILLITATACNKKLDVTPAQNITPDQIQTAADVKAVLFGSYKSLQHFNTYGERYKLMGETRTWEASS